MFYSAMREPAFPTSGLALQGPNGQDASALIAGLKVGANLAGMQQNLGSAATFHLSTRLGTRDAYTDMMPGHPTFGFRGSAGVNVGTAGLRGIHRRQSGRQALLQRGAIAGARRRRAIPRRGRRAEGRHRAQAAPIGATAGTSGFGRCTPTTTAATPRSRSTKDRSRRIITPGPLWAIFDQDSVERAEWELRFPYVADNGYYFKADTIEELAAKIEKGHEFQRVPLKHLADTVTKWNGYVDAGKDPDFEREGDAPMHKVARPPFHALAIMVVWHDSYGGLRVNGKHQVIDMRGEVDPRSVCRRRSRRRFPEARPRQGPRAWVHRGHERGRGAVAALEIPMEPHATRVVVWDTPSAIECGSVFHVKVGVKCALECGGAARRVEIRDEHGRGLVCGFVADAPLPGTSGLFVADLDASRAGEPRPPCVGSLRRRRRRRRDRPNDAQRRERRVSSSHGAGTRMLAQSHRRRRAKRHTDSRRQSRRASLPSDDGRYTASQRSGCRGARTGCSSRAATAFRFAATARSSADVTIRAELDEDFGPSDAELWS